MDIAPGDRIWANFITPPLYLGLCAEGEHYGLVWRELGLSGETRALVRGFTGFCFERRVDKGVWLLAEINSRVEPLIR